MEMMVRLASLLFYYCGTFAEAPLTISRIFIVRIQGHIAQLKRTNKYQK